MTGYQKKIAYLDYLENGMKIRNAGFVRIEKNNGQARLEMQVKNLPESCNGQYELKADAGGTVGRISLVRGKGSCCIVWRENSVAPEGKKTVPAGGVYVRLQGRHLLKTDWQMPIKLQVEEEPERETDPPDNVEEASLSEESAPEAVASKEEMPEEQAEPEQGDSNLRKAMPAQEGTAAWDSVSAKPCDMFPRQQWEMVLEAVHKESVRQEEAARCAEAASDEKTPEPVCYGDKWEQMTHMFPAIHPFGDDRTYLSIAPKDFVVLRQEYQKMVHNSFLLHGYYNYRHLILGRIRQKEEWKYYLGVPGNFYNREKMVAEMFGFEAFEGEKDPARAGDFGYFMKRVEI